MFGIVIGAVLAVVYLVCLILWMADPDGDNFSIGIFAWIATVAAGTSYTYLNAPFVMFLVCLGVLVLPTCFVLIVTMTDNPTGHW